VNEKKNREIEDSGRRRGHRWPGGPACGAEAASAPRAPYFEDGDIWRSELLKRQVQRHIPVFFAAPGIRCVGSLSDSG